MTQRDKGVVAPPEVAEALFKRLADRWYGCTKHTVLMEILEDAYAAGRKAALRLAEAAPTKLPADARHIMAKNREALLLDAAPAEPPVARVLDALPVMWIDPATAGHSTMHGLKSGPIGDYTMPLYASPTRQPPPTDLGQQRSSVDQTLSSLSGAAEVAEPNRRPDTGEVKAVPLTTEGERP